MILSDSDKFERALEGIVAFARGLAELVFLVAVFRAAAVATDNIFLHLVSALTAAALAAFGGLCGIKMTKALEKKPQIWMRVAGTLAALVVTYWIGQLSINAVDALMLTALTEA